MGLSRYDYYVEKGGQGWGKKNLSDNSPPPITVIIWEYIII